MCGGKQLSWSGGQCCALIEATLGVRGRSAAAEVLFDDVCSFSVECRGSDIGPISGGQESSATCDVSLEGNPALQAENQLLSSSAPAQTGGFRDYQHP